MSAIQYYNGVGYRPSTPKKVWRKIRKCIQIDSRDRQQVANSHSGDYTVTLPAVYTGIYSIGVRSYEIPNTVYAISSCRNNNTFTFNDGSDHALAIPDGNYDATSLAAALQVAIRTIDGVFSVTLSPVSNKYVFTTATGDFSLTFATTAATGSANCGSTNPIGYASDWGLGYYVGFDVGTATSATNSLTATYVPRAPAFRYLDLDLEQLNKIDSTAIDNKKSGRIDGTFTKIQMNVPVGSVAFYEDTSVPPVNTHIYNPPVAKLGQLHVRFREHDGRIVNFNGAEHSFTLEIETLDSSFDEYSGMMFSGEIAP